jgi:hypothetical protein
VAALGTQHALLATAACHLVAAAAIRVWLPSLPAAAKPAGQPPVSMLRQSWTVNRQLIADPAVRILLLVTWLPPAFLAAAESLIVPYAAQHRFPAGSPGLMLACVPAGMIAGDFAVGRLLRPANRERPTIPLMITAGLPLLAFAAAPRWPRRSSGRYRHRPRLHPRIQRRFPDAVPAPSSARHSGCSTGLMTFQALGPPSSGQSQKSPQLGAQWRSPEQPSS